MTKLINMLLSVAGVGPVQVEMILCALMAVDVDWKDVVSSKVVAAIIAAGIEVKLMEKVSSVKLAKAIKRQMFILSKNKGMKSIQSFINFGDTWFILSSKVGKNGQIFTDVFEKKSELVTYMNEGYANIYKK